MTGTTHSIRGYCLSWLLLALIKSRELTSALNSALFLANTLAHRFTLRLGRARASSWLPSIARLFVIAEGWVSLHWWQVHPWFGGAGPPLILLFTCGDTAREETAGAQGGTTGYSHWKQEQVWARWTFPWVCAFANHTTSCITSSSLCALPSRWAEIHFQGGPRI